VKLFRIAAVLMLAVAATLLTASPGHAGGWATTLLDPLPDRLESGRAYTVGYWVLQHGSHPYEGDLGRTALRLVDDAGTSTTYLGTPLPESGHYAAAVVFGHAGSWKLRGVQGVFGEYEIGEVSVPGGVRVEPTPPPRVADHGGGSHWGAIRPPLAADLMPAGAVIGAAPLAAPATTAPGRQVVPRPLVAGVVLAAVIVVLLVGWRLRTRRAARRSARPSTGS
jgi:hypothetical protein